MRILFLTRVHPPIIGGLENQSYNLIENFKKINKDTFVIKNTYGKKAIPFFIPYSFFRSLYLIWKNKIECLHLSDGVLSLEGSWIKKLTGVKTVITIHGLDITYNNKFYQAITPKAINKLDKVICVSNATKEECMKRRVNPKKIIVIPNGVNPNEFYIDKPREELREEMSKEINLNLKNKKILLTSGRLIKRKGVEWFVENVMPKLSEDYLYLVLGDGPERESIEKVMLKNNSNNVKLLGRANFETLKLLYNLSDVFVMPNLKIKGDIEGFGLVALEAASVGLPVVASNIEGIKDSVKNNITGFLVEEKNSEDFMKAIKNTPKLDRNKIRLYTRNNFSWDKIAKKYLEVFYLRR